MVSVTKHGLILEKTDNVFENLGVLNPAIYQEGNTVHMLYRAARKGNFSSVGYCKLDGPLKVVERFKEPVFFPKESYEFQGIEDPRIVKIEGTYYMTYAAFDAVNVFGAVATSQNLIKWDRIGVVTPQFTFDKFAHLIEPTTDKISKDHYLFYNLFMLYRLKDIIKSEVYVWDKNLVFFPKKLNGKFALLHRFQPSIQLVYFKDFSELTTEFWEKYIKNLHKHIVMSPKYIYANSHIGPGCPPIETDEGWLLIFHSAQYAPKGYMYHASAALLDLDNPKKVVGRLRKPLFSPTEPWEKAGYVTNIVFPTGTALFGEELYIYYGTADSRIAVASLNIKDLLQELKNSKP